MYQLRTINLGGPVHYADFGGTGPTLVLVHGLGGSHLNWMQVGPGLARRFRVVAPDLAGFGVTPLAGRSASVPAQAALLGRFIDAVAGEPALLVGNSMGGLVSVLLAGQRPETVSGLVLVNPAQPTPRSGRVDPAVLTMFVLYAMPGVGELYTRARAARLGPEGMVRGILSLCTPDVSRLPDEVIQRHIELAKKQAEEMPWTNRAYLEAARSLLRLTLRAKGHYALERKVVAPTLLMHGAADRMVSVLASRELAARRPDWSYVEFAGVGHAPMMEVPERFISVLERWLSGPGRQAVEGQELAAAS